MSQSANKAAPVPSKRTNISIIGLIGALTSPLISIFGLLTMLVGLAYDVPRADPTPFQSAANNLFVSMITIYFWVSIVLVPSCLLLGLYGFFARKSMYSKLAIITAAVLLIVACIMWWLSIVSIPPEAVLLIHS